MQIFCVAFRHLQAGEGIGGIEWDHSPALALERVISAEVVTDHDYEIHARWYEVNGKEFTTNESITDYLDALVWESWSR